MATNEVVAIKMPPAKASFKSSLCWGTASCLSASQGCMVRLHTVHVYLFTAPLSTLVLQHMCTHISDGNALKAAAQSCLMLPCRLSWFLDAGAATTVTLPSECKPEADMLIILQAMLAV